MFRELPDAEIASVESLFTNPHLRLVIRSVLQGNSPARIWVDRPIAPQTALMWDLRHCIYLTGDAQRAASSGAFQGFLTDIAAEAKAAGIHNFRVCYSDSSWEAAVQEILPALRRRNHVLLKLDPGHGPGPSRLPDGFRTASIDRQLLDAVKLKNLNLVLDEISGGWPTVARFLEYGFGVAVRNDEAVVCWCTAEYVSEGRCGVGIETIPAYQGRGLATNAATAFVAECATRGITAYWESWRDNHPSLRVAQRVGFQPLYDFNV
ncbi:MAG TPA: GNAT family N-acetyltransferase, partial [Chloroflexota bacterium]|nr:GNAT family N-acetyltransferase [Chloroflexota bacterium]